MSQDINLDLMVDVHDDHVVLHLPDFPSFPIYDRHLDDLFYYPEKLSEICLDEQKFMFWYNLIPNIIRIRERKRDLYYDMENFCAEFTSP